MTPQQFRDWRKAQELTQAQVAEQFGVSLRSVSNYETGGPIPKLVELACLALATQKGIPTPFTGPNIAALVKEQHPTIGSHVIAMPQHFPIVPSYRAVTKMVLTDEASEFIREEVETAKFSIRPVDFDQYTRHAVPVITFEDETEMVYFAMRWR